MTYLAKGGCVKRDDIATLLGFAPVAVEGDDCAVDGRGGWF
jgi:hypothetical protein